VTTDPPLSQASQLPPFDQRQFHNGALEIPCPFLGAAYTWNCLIPSFKKPIRNYGAEIATCDGSDTVQ
ncbi:hypothetical protein, partial [Pseudomonas fluorescens]|uniref:hypothetical protein n=1 Tax=Pseudomonas fluorescens TaxID=294 RepID=UPI001E5CD045